MGKTSGLLVLLFCCLTGVVWAAPSLVCSVNSLPDGTTYSRLDENCEVFAFRLFGQESGFLITSMDLSCVGTADPDVRVQRATLWDDLNGNGRCDEDETQLALSDATPFSGGKTRIDGLSYNVPENATKSLILSYDFSDCPGYNETYFTSLDMVSASLVGNVQFPLPWSDDVESGAGQWTAEGGWGITTEQASSPTHSWTDSPGGNYASNANAILTSRVFDLSLAASDAVLSFAHRYDTEGLIDYCYVEVSTNGGGSWTQLASYSGSLPNWTQVTLPLSSYRTSQFQFRFRFASDGGYELDGWYLDDIQLTGSLSALSGSKRGQEITLNNGILPGVLVSTTLPADGTSYVRGATDAEVFAFDLTAQNYSLTLDGLGFQTSGSGNESQYVNNARIFLDADGDRRLTEADGSPLANLGTTSDNGPFPASAQPWTLKASMMSSGYGFGCGVVYGKMYAIGGGRYTGPYFNSVGEYNPRTNSWVQKADMPTARYRFACAAVNGKIYAIGGYGYSGFLNIVEEYDPILNSWTTKAPMPTTRSGIACAAVNGKIYVIGGNTSGRPKDTIKTVEEYDPATNTWKSKASMSTARYRFGCAAVNGKVYVIGGQGSTGRYNDIFYGLSSVEEYDPAMNIWSTKASMSKARDGLACGVLDGKIFAIGGSGLRTVEAYDPATNTWVTKESMLTPQNAIACGVLNGNLYSIGGTGNGSEVEVYVPPVVGVNADLPLGTPVSFLLAYDFSGAPGPQGSYGVALTRVSAKVAPCDFVVNSFDGDGVGIPVTLEERQASLDVAIRNPDSNPSYCRGSTDATVLAFDLSTVNYGADLASVVISSAGTGNESTDILNARLWLDNDGSRTKSDGDLLVKELSGAYTQDNGAITFSPSLGSVPMGETRSYVMTYDFIGGPASASYLFQAKVDSFSATVKDYPSYQPTVTYSEGALGPNVKMVQSIATETPTPQPTSTPTVTPENPTSTPTPVPTIDPRTDINGDGVVDERDLLLLMQNWKLSE